MLRNISVMLIFIFSSVTFALGIGSADVQSYLNQYLILDIEIIGSKKETTNPYFSANLAALEDFQRAGVQYDSFLVNLKAQIIQKQGKKYLRLTSKETVKEPVLDFLIAASTRNNRSETIKVLKRISIAIEPPYIDLQKIDLDI